MKADSYHTDTSTDLVGTVDGTKVGFDDGTLVGREVGREVGEEEGAVRRVREERKGEERYMEKSVWMN